jgi:hypothetical protein
MTTTTYAINSTTARRRQVRLIRLLFAGAATFAVLALFGVARPGDAESVVAAPQFSQAAPSMSGAGGFAIDQPDPGWNADPGWDFQQSS